MMGIGFPELMIILVIIMIIFGAGKLPEIGSAFGNSIRNFKKSMKEVDEMKEDMDVSESVAEVTEGGDADNSPAEESSPASENQETPEPQENKA